MNRFLVETTEIVKRQYLVDATDAIAATDAVEMKEVRYYDKHSLAEIITSVTACADEYSHIPNANPVREAKILVALADELAEVSE